MTDNMSAEERKEEFAIDDEALDHVTGGMQLSVNFLNELQQTVQKYPALQEILNNREAIMRFLSDAAYREEVFAKAKDSFEDSDFLQKFFR